MFAGLGDQDVGFWVGPLSSQPQVGSLTCRLSVSPLRGQAVARAGGDTQKLGQPAEEMGAHSGSRAGVPGTNTSWVWSTGSMGRDRQGDKQ